MTLSTETAHRLRKLIPRLSTDSDGERLATVAAIERTLRSTGTDWHDLADSIDPADLGSRGVAGEYSTRHQPSEYAKRESAPGWRSLDRCGRINWLDVVIRWRVGTERAVRFAIDTRRRIIRDRNATLTAPQEEWATALIRNAYERGYRPQGRPAA